jgi:hypothetical protein
MLPPSSVLWVVTSCSVVVGYQRFRGPCPTTTLNGVTTQKTSTWICNLLTVGVLPISAINNNKGHSGLGHTYHLSFPILILQTDKHKKAFNVSKERCLLFTVPFLWVILFVAYFNVPYQHLKGGTDGNVSLEQTFTGCVQDRSQMYRTKAQAISMWNRVSYAICTYSSLTKLQRPASRF